MEDFEDEVLGELSTDTWKSIDEIALGLHGRRIRRLGDRAAKPTSPELYRTLDGLKSACKVEKRNGSSGMSEWRKRAILSRMPDPVFIGGGRVPERPRAYA